MTLENENKGKRKDKYLFLLFFCDHFTKDCPHCEEINIFLKNNPTPTVLTDPFLSQQQLIDHMSSQGTSNSTEEIQMISAETANLTTHIQTYEK